MTIGERVREIRDNNHWTQGELAARLGWDRSRVAHLESGRYGDVKASTLQEVAHAFAMDLADLLRGVDFPKKPMAAR